MITIEIIPSKPVDSYPTPVVNAVNCQRDYYPDMLNNTPEKLFDRTFEQMNPGTTVKYNPDRLVWENDADYTLFCLRWS